MTSQKSLFSTTLPGKMKRSKSTILRLSSSDWGKSANKTSFPKETRFKHIPSNTQNATMPNLGSTLSKRSISFTRSSKSFSYKLEGPGPSSYEIKSDFDHLDQRPGTVFKTSSDSRTYYTVNQVPGPGAYKTEESWINKNKGVRLKSRIGDIYTSHNTPGPSAYWPNIKLISQARYSKIGFGFGERHNFIGRDYFTPGPGSYNPDTGLHSKFKSDQNSNSHSRNHSRKKNKKGNKNVEMFDL